jgi:hypothetical protein
MQIVYKTTNLINGKSYVGKDSKNRYEYLGSGIVLNKSIKKYGKENFIKETVAWCDTKEHLDFLERFYIKFFKTKSPNGYNLTDGGDGLTNPSREVREKISKSCIGRIRPIEVRLKISKSTKGIKKLPLNELHKLHISLAKKGQLCGDNNPAKRPEVGAKIKKLKGRKVVWGNKISKTLTGKQLGHPWYHNDDTRNKMRDSHIGKPSARKGKHYPKRASL